MERSTSRPFVFLLLILLITPFLFLSFYHINQQSILYHDAGMYLLETKFLDEGFRMLLSWNSGELQQNGFWENIKTKTEGVPLHSNKPGFNTVLWLAGTVLGVHDTLSAKVTAAAGILNILLMFLIARRLGTRRSAIYSAAFLASSVFYLVYSRAGLAEQVTTFFFLAGLTLYVYSQQRASAKALLYGAGFFLGCAFTCNHWRVLFMPFAVMGLDFLTAFLHKKWSWKVLTVRLICIILGFLTPIFLFQAPYILGKAVMGSMPLRDYWFMLFRFLNLVNPQVVWFKRVGELAQEYFLVEGPLFSGLVLSGWIFILIRFLGKSRFEDMFLLFFSLIPFTYFSLGKSLDETLPRAASNLIPIAAVCVGEMLSKIQETLEGKVQILKKAGVGFSVVLVAGFLIQAFPKQFEISRTGTGYAEASRYLRATGKKKFMLLGMEPVWRFYLGRAAHKPYDRPQSMKALVEEARKAGIDHLVLDYTTIHGRHGVGYTTALIGRQTPLAVFENSRGNSLPHLLDEYGYGPSQKVAQDPKSKYIYIFNIGDIRA